MPFTITRRDVKLRTEKIQQRALLNFSILISLDSCLPLVLDMVKNYKHTSSSIIYSQREPTSLSLMIRDGPDIRIRICIREHPHNFPDRNW